MENKTSTMLNKEDLIKYIKEDINKWNEIRTEYQSDIIDLDNMDFGEINLANANLNDLTIRNSDLSKTKGLKLNQLAGSDLTSSILPDKLINQDLELLTEQIKLTKFYFAIVIFTSIYCILTILINTNDINLITNTGSFLLPVINTSVSVVGFYIAAPIILLSIFIYFQFYLYMLVNRLAELPAIFSDGKSLDEKVFPWILIVILIKSNLKMLKGKLAFIEQLIKFILYFLVWFLVPITISAIYLRYLISHNNIVIIHSILIAASILIAITFYSENRHKLKKERIKYIDTYAVSIMIVAFFTPMFFDTYVRYGSKINIPFIYPNIHSQKICATLDKSCLNPNNIDYIPVNLEEKNLRYAEATGVYLIRANLDKVNLEGSILKYSNLEGASLNYANLKNTNLEYSKLKGSAMQNVDLSKSSLSNINLESADLTKASLNSSNLDNANLKSAVLQSAKFQKAKLKYADLKGVNASHADFQNSNIEDINFNEANLENANIMNVIATYGEFQSANLSYANLRGADLSYADFSNANLSEAELQSANLYKANLYNANLEGAKLSNVKNLTMRQIKKAKLNEDTILPSYLKK